MTAITTKFNTCPVCFKRVAETGGVEALYYQHTDTVGKWCPMSGKPVPAPEVMAQ